MGKEVYTYLKYDGNNLTYCNEIDGQYEIVDKKTITANGSSGDQIIWQCEGGIESISAISKNEGSDQIFTDGVNPINPKCWAGTVKQMNGVREIEWYTIIFIDSDGNTHTIDPGSGGGPD